MFANGEYEQLLEAVDSLEDREGLVILIHPDFLLKTLEGWYESGNIDRQGIFSESPRKVLGKKIGATIITTATNELFVRHSCQFLLLKEIDRYEKSKKPSEVPGIRTNI